MLSGGSRITQHIRECNYHHNQLGLGFGLGLGFCSSAKRLDLSSSFVVRPPSVSVSDSNRSSYHHARSSIFPDLSLPLAGCIQPRSPSGQSPVLSDCFSQQEDDDNAPPQGSTSVAGGIVALGKFDALHIGHRELAIQAAKAGMPFLLSFVGMAEVLGWEPRAPIVAKCDRKRVLSSWAPYCGNLIPAEYEVQFSKVRQLTPRQFVEKLSKELGVSGVVAGQNYRFGYRAAGTALDLVKLCNEYGMEAYIINSVMDRNQNPRIIGSGNTKEKGQVSSTRVRHALAKGEMKYVSELLGRQHRLVLAVKGQEWSLRSQRIVSARTSCLLNLAPKDGLYESCSLFAGGENGVPCRVSIDANDVCLEVDDVAICERIISGEYRCLAIDFGEC